MPNITEILPQYTRLNVLITEILDRCSIELEQQIFILDFYDRFNDIQAFEMMLIDLVTLSEMERGKILLNSLCREIQRFIQLVSENKQTFESIDIKKMYTKITTQYDDQINCQLFFTQEAWREYKKVDNSLDTIGFKEHEQQEEKLLWEEHNDLKKRYNAEKQILSDLYDQKKEAVNRAQNYLDNRFLLLLSLSQTFSDILEKYLPKTETTLQNGTYFDMSLISAIHKECNDEQFESISELDLYAILNLLPSTGRFIIKKGKLNRIYFLIHKLYELLPKENNKVWRTAILLSFQLDERKYFSKYLIAKSKDASPELRMFAENLDELFKEFGS